MSTSTDRALRIAFALGLGLAAVGVSPGAAPAAGPAGAELRLAQASQPRGAPHRAAPQAQAPAQPSGEQDAERQIADLKKRLNITPQQQAEFDGFAQAMRQNAQAMDQLTQQEQQNATHNAVEDLRAAAKFSKAEAEGLERLLPPLQTLYNALSDQQKRVADQVMTSDGGAPPPAPAGKKR